MASDSPSRVTASATTAAVLAQIREEMGLVVGPFTVHEAVPELLAAVWAAFRETVLAEGRLPLAAKEAMAVAVSEANRCPYCVDAHAVRLHAAGAGRVEAALRRGRRERLDERTRALVAWAAATGRPGSPELAAPPFAPEERPEAVGTVLGFHYINRVVTVRLAERLLPVRAPWLRSPLLWLIGARLARPVRGRRRPGDSLGLLPAGPRPAPPAWAEGAPAIGAAFAALEGAAARAAAVLGGELLERLQERLDAWQGEEPPLGGAWLEEALRGLEPPARAAARVLLLTALAPHRVTPAALAEYGRYWPGDDRLAGGLAWAAFAAARRISTWLDPGDPPAARVPLKSVALFS